ncbi:MAG: FAD binding domain-containing protein [Geminicoccaceae bacterium]
MKPAPFAYHRVASRDEAFALLDRHGDEARLLAGGQSLVPMLNLRIARVGHLVDINPLGELDFVRPADGAIEVGALTRHVTLERSELVRRACPILAAAAHRIGHLAIRERGTLGGSLALADPAAELPMIATLLDADLELGSSRGSRSIGARAFFVAMLTTALQPNEVLIRARFPALAPGEGFGLRALSRRAGDFAIVMAGATVRLDDRHRVGHVRLALGGAAPTPLALTRLERVQQGTTPDADWPDAVAAVAAAEVEPHGDQHASAEHRRELVRVLLARALRDALARADAGG